MLPDELNAILSSRGKAAFKVLAELDERATSMVAFIRTMLLGFRLIKQMGVSGTRPNSAASSAVDYLKRQKANGYQHLLHTVVVFLWGLVEAAIEDVAITWLAHEALSSTAGNPVTNDATVRAKQKIREMRREIRNQNYSGFDRFDQMLQRVGINGHIMTPELNRTITEMQLVRNVILHRAAIVDTVFCQKCWWRKETRGKYLKLTAEDVDRYVQAVQYYTYTLKHSIIMAEMAS